MRKAAVTALPELVNDAFLAVQNPQVATDPAHDARWVKAMLDAVLAGLCEAALKEPDTEIVAAMLEAVKETIDYAGELLQVSIHIYRRHVLVRARERLQDSCGQLTRNENAG